MGMRSIALNAEQSDHQGNRQPRVLRPCIYSTCAASWHIAGTQDAHTHVSWMSWRKATTNVCQLSDAAHVWHTMLCSIVLMRRWRRYPTIFLTARMFANVCCTPDTRYAVCCRRWRPRGRRASGMQPMLPVLPNAPQMEGGQCTAAGG